VIDNVDDAQDFISTKEALSLLGVSDENQQQVRTRRLGGLLSLTLLLTLVTPTPAGH
jgi:myosin heavy subunit